MQNKRMRIRILSVLLSLLLLGKVSGQAGATLEILTPDVCVPGKVSMRVINCNSCISYDWEVIAGSGFKNASSDFSTIINDTGWIDVSVKLKTSAGAIILIGKKKAIYGRKAPTISFSVSQPLFCKAIDTLEVTDHTPNVKSRDWLIDGTVFYNGPATLKYSPPPVQGYKSIYLLVRDSWDCKGALYKDSAVSVWDSITAAVNPTKKQGCAPAYVDFAFDADTGYQRISSVFWGFQNGIPGFSNQRTAKNIYYDKGDTNDLFLKLTTDKGCTYSYRRNN